MADEIKITFSADEKAVLAAYQKLMKENQKFREELAKGKKGAEESGKSLTSMLSAGISQLGKMAAGWVSVQSAIQLATAEYQNYLDVQKKSAAATIDTANAQIVFFRNLGNVTSEQARKIQETVKAVASANKTTEGRVYSIATEAISSRGSLSYDQMFANIGMAARLAPENAGEATAIASALNATSRLTGSADPNVNAGLLLGIGEQTRIPSMSGIADTLVPSAAGVKATLPGTSTAEAAAFFSTLTTISEDKTGAQSGTASMQLAAQLRKYRNATDLGDEVAKLQGSKADRDKFLKQASFEVKARPFLEQMLTGGTPAAQLLAESQAKIPIGDTAVATTNQFFQNIGQTPYQRIAQLDRSFAATQSQLQLTNLLGAEGGVTRQGIQQVLSAANASSLEQTFAGAMFNLQTMTGTAPRESAIELLQQRSRALRGWNPDDSPRDVAENPTDEMMAKRLDVFIAELRGLRSDLKNAPKRKNIDQHNE